MPGPRPVIIDTDGGIDDAAAIWWAVTDPYIEVLAVTVVAGNVERDLAARNVLTVLESAGRPDIPVALGEPRPIGAAPAPRNGSRVHGSNGLGDAVHPPPSIRPVAEPAGELLRRLVGERPGEIVLITIGPLSTIGRVVSVDERFAEAVGELVVMGGAITTEEAGRPAVETNIRHDPEAAQRVLQARWPAPPLLVPLDVTMQATLGEHEFRALAERLTPVAAFLDEPMQYYRRARGGGECPCHDLLAVLSVVEPGVLPESPVRRLAVDTGPGDTRGATTERPWGTPWRVALRADVDRFRQLVTRWLTAGKAATNIPTTR